MYPTLILREEFACLAILVFLLLMGRSYRMGRDDHVFKRLTVLAIVHVSLDILTVWTVNHRAQTPEVLNYLFHIFFYLSAILYSNEIFRYVLRACYPRAPKYINRSGFGLAALYLISLPFLRINYLSADLAVSIGTNSSGGSAAYVGYGVAYLYFLSALVLILKNRKRLGAPVTNALLPMMLVLICAETAQMIWKELLLTGAALTVVTVGFFFSLENPVRVFERKAMVDALTGVKSRRSFETDLAVWEKCFAKDRRLSMRFLLFRPDGLGEINGRSGHAAGDECIAFLAESLLEKLSRAEDVYRLSGDEFIAVYRGAATEAADQESNEAVAHYRVLLKDWDPIPELMTCQVTLSGEYASVAEALKMLDYRMYRVRSGRRLTAGAEELNLTGLTDRVFDAMSVADERYCPFITNLTTNVTRISDSWAEYFGLDDVFFNDFGEVWEEHVSPKDRDAFREALVGVLSGTKRYLFSDYRARNREGRYVTVSVRGSVYRGKDGEPDIFTGFLLNHGLESSVDPLTGLLSYAELTTRMDPVIREGRKAALIKLDLGRINRINMLYGYEAGQQLLGALGEALTETVGTDGTVFCGDRVNFTVLLPEGDQEKAKQVYERIRAVCTTGIRTPLGYVPVQVTGGAICLPSPDMKSCDAARTRLIFALDASVEAGQGGLSFYHELPSSAAVRDLELLSAVHADALKEENGFLMHYQPIIEPATGHMISVEALIRWRSEKYGLVMPGRFIAEMENDPVFYRVGLNMIRRAAKDLHRLSECMPELRINVNLTAPQLLNRDLDAAVEQILREEQIRPERLVLELTERCKEIDTEGLSRRIRELRSRGFRVAFDDMGTGYSTIDLLLNIPVDEIKLDRSFTVNLESNLNYQAFAAALVGAAERDGIEVCFEGVEDEQTLSRVTEIGPSLVQGYYYARPMGIEELMTWAGENSKDCP